MNRPLKIVKIGNSAGMILPKELLARLHSAIGDQVYVTEAPDGSLRLTPNNPEFEEAMEVAEAIMREDRDILRVLAR